MQSPSIISPFLSFSYHFDVIGYPTSDIYKKYCVFQTFKLCCIVKYRNTALQINFHPLSIAPLLHAINPFKT